MQKALILRIVLIAIMAILICIPLGMIESTVSERKSFREEAIRSVTLNSVGPQTLVGPLLMVPYVERYVETVTDEAKPKAAPKTIEHRVNHILTIFPEHLIVKSAISTERRHRGIHQILMFSGDHDIEADYILPERNAFVHDVSNADILIGQAYLSMVVGDVRGIRKVDQARWNEAALEFKHDSGLALASNGLHADIPTAIEHQYGQHFNAHMSLSLDGIESQSFMPIGKSNAFAVKSNWPHPQFGGNFLPSIANRVQNADGFSASWNISSLANDSQQQLESRIGRTQFGAAATGDGGLPTSGEFSISLIEPVNIYVQANRAVKYGVMFVTLTFVAFFVFELIKRTRIHPIQYALAGLALTLFFLLPLSLSEHVAFHYAYLGACTGSIAMITLYLASVLKSWAQAIGFGVGLSGMFAALYEILKSENNALLMGSMLLFVLLGLVMLVTRKLDWYRLNLNAQADS